VPDAPDALDRLPGIGPYTAGAIACFAYNYPSVFIETNIRAGLLHFFYGEHEAPANRDLVRDSELLLMLSAALDEKEENRENRENPRKWYWALMDYGAAVKKTFGNPNKKSAHYPRQSKFEGSFRQRRGAVLKALVSQEPVSAEDLCRRYHMTPQELHNVLASLEKDRLFSQPPPSPQPPAVP
jgi:A/G-specific adenine glycosylase